MDNTLLEQLYREYAKSLLLYIYSICRDFGLAEELMHETFIKAMLSLETEDNNFKSWLFTVGKNLTLNNLKKEKRIIVTDDFDDFRSNENVLSELIENEEYRKLYETILAMPEKMRQVVTLHYFSGLSLKEIGVIMDMKPGNVRIVSYRARQHMKKKLEGNHDF